MLSSPIDILKFHPIRKNRKQKDAFRADVAAYAEGLGYPCRMEKGSLGAVNILLGDPDTAKYLITAHYDTPARMLFPNLITPCNLLVFIVYQVSLLGFLIIAAIAAGVIFGLAFGSAELASGVGIAVYWILLLLMMLGPANKNNVNDNSSGVITVLEIARTLLPAYRDKVCFVLFDLEEAGLIGSASYRKTHKKTTDQQIIFNLDCVGDGDHLFFFPTKKARQNSGLMNQIRRMGGWFGQKQIIIKDKGFYLYQSDQMNFAVGFAVAAMKKSKVIGYYCDRIHTPRDTVLDNTNINILRAALSTIISGNAVN